MHPPTTDFLQHAKWIRRAVLEAGGDLVIDGDSLRAFVRNGRRQWVLHPQFLGHRDGLTWLTGQLLPESVAFTGWLLERGAAPLVPADRLEFRQLAASLGLRVPPHHVEPSSPVSDVVVRRSPPSLGQQLDGPYRSSAERPLDAGQKEFFETLVEGDGLTVWYWGGQAVCAEIAAAPGVVGDGRAAVRELLERQERALGLHLPDHELDRAEREAYLRYRSLDPDRVLAAGERVATGLGDDRRPLALRERRTLDLGRAADLPWARSVQEAGELIAGHLPPAARRTAYFTLEGIVDASGVAWLTSSGANPIVHPLVYPAMIASLVAAAATETPATPEPALEPARA